MPENKTQITAVALAYHHADTAIPKVVAKGRGITAQEIIRRARESDIYVHESAELVALLMQVNLDERIPSQLYIAVAELLAWLYYLEQEKNPASPSGRQGNQYTTQSRASE